MDVQLAIKLEDLVNAAGHWLELFDSSFAQDNVPLHARPVKSAMWLVRDGVQEMPFGDSGMDFLDKEWFAALVIAIREWYRDRYGAAAFEPVRDVLSGLVLLYGTPVKIEARVTVAEVEVEGETSWLIFPDAIHKSESLQSFFPTRPNLNTLPTEDRGELEVRVATIVRSARSINLALQAAAGTVDEVAQMAAGVWGHVEKAVVDILTLTPAVAAVGCWELHLAVEKAFKIFLMQMGSRMMGHDLNTLSKASTKHGLVVTETVLAKLPDWHRAINLRYGEVAIEIAEAIENYNAALQLVYEITDKLQRAYRFNNAGFLLKKPPWVGRGT
ncbi:MAG: hypothetical protein ABIK82_12575 [Pseudomonadota bacterium]